MLLGVVRVLGHETHAEAVLDFLVCQIDVQHLAKLLALISGEGPLLVAYGQLDEH